MPKVVLYFQVHQPYRLNNYSIFSNSRDESYFNEKLNEKICRKVAANCYLPANKIILELIRKYQGKFKVAFSITGTALEQFENYCPQVLASFRNLAKTGEVEFLGETNYHSLAFLYDREEFYQQIKIHEEKMLKYFDYQPKVFRNTELIYQNQLADFLENIGYQAVLTEGTEKILDWRSPNYVYHSKNNRLKILLKNFKLSDDIAFRFSDNSWNEWPLTAEKYAGWLGNLSGQADIVNLFMDYETFGEHQWADTGIFDFLAHLPQAILNNRDNGFLLPAQAVENYQSVGEVDVPVPISWADVDRDISAWTGNAMQTKALKRVYDLAKSVKQTNDSELIEDWRRLTTSDHFYYMCTKFWTDGDVHKYFSPFASPYDAFITYMNVLDNLQKRIKKYYNLNSQCEYATKNERR